MFRSYSVPFVTAGTSPEYVERFPNVIGASFLNEPLHQWITLYTETLPNDTTLTPE